MAKWKKTQHRPQQKSKDKKTDRPRHEKATKIAKKNKNTSVAKAVETKAGAKDKKDKSKKKSKMSVEDFFNGGFEDNEDELDKELENMETIEEQPDEDISDSEPEQPAQQDTDDDESSIDQEMIDNDEAMEEDDQVDDNDVEEESSNQSDASSNNDSAQDATSDDDDEDDEDEQDTKDSRKKLVDDINKHKKELEKLKKSDPEFYKYLQEEENNLLEFDESADDVPEDDEQDDDQDMDMDDAEDSEPELEESDQEEVDTFGDDLELLTKRKVSEMIEQVDSKKTLPAMKKLLLAFKTAARMSDEEQQEGVSFVYKIQDPKVFNMVVTGTMRCAPMVFNHFLKSNKTPSASPRWHVAEGAIKSYLTNMLHLMRGLTDSDMLYLAAREAEKCSAYWVCFQKMVKDYLKVLLELWSTFTSSDTLRIQSFLAIRSLAVARVHKGKPNTYLDLCLKNIYLTFVRNCKGTNEHTLPSINLMRNLATQLYAIDLDLSYQQAFVYIRQLAIHLRNAMQLKNKESYQSVYNWQFVHCIDFWSNVLAANCADSNSPLYPLVYPLTQVALGAIQLVPTAQYFPARFHIIRSMITLARSTKVYIPLAPYLMQLLESRELTVLAKPSTLKPLMWDVHLRAPKQYLHGRVYQDGIIEQLCECISEYYKSYAYHISFPEMVIPGIVAIKRFVKKRNATKTANIKGNKKLLDVTSKLELKANFVLTQRSKIDFSPSDQEQVSKFIDDMRQKLQ
ncbi:Noc2-domain-containing protein [Lichtheimia hyalospora FSU 10163]|nr:Noc2-domain-containing protein [Lichtheimia hyalospora FSU 10163]